MTEFKSIYVKPKSLLRQLIQKLFLKLLSKLFPKKFLSYKDKIRFAMDRSAYYLDLYVTNFDDESNTLYRNEGGLIFTDVTARWGLDAPTRLSVGFGVVAADLDGDGDLDLAVTNGHIIDNIELYHDGKTHAQRALLLENLGAKFQAVGAGEFGQVPRVGRCLLAGDLDGDGDLDLVETVCGGDARVYRNDTARGGAGGAGVQSSYLGAVLGVDE